MEQIVVFAIPIFITLMIVEFVYGWKKKSNTYQLADTLGNLMLGLISRVFGYALQFFHIGIYVLVFHALWGNQQFSFWNSWFGLIVAVIAFDFFDYWLHRTEHESAIFWAAHVVHHQSEQFNLSVALRQVTTEPILGFIFYLPLALMGIPPELFTITTFIVLFYQFWVHTEHIGKLGWFDRIFDSPSNHRVHHAINPQYIDRNYGSIFVIWDRLFGTYEPEIEPPVYGTVKPFRHLNPIWASCIEYVNVAKKMGQAHGAQETVKAILASPGWQPSTPNPNASIDLAQAYQTRLQEGPSNHFPLRPAAAWFAIAQFLVLSIAAIATMDVQDTLSTPSALLCIGALLSGFWALAKWMQNQLKTLIILLIDIICLTVLYQQLI
jgi:sterol desaturase/sphingolipid hydroxylase (fatty acid hydroxylase superfamily)